MYHATKPSQVVSSAQEEAALGPEWSRKYIYQAYPRMKYHWSGKTVTVKDCDEEIALGGGWADSPSAFDAYKGARPARTKEQDPAKWLDQWLVPDLSADHRKKIKAVLLRADGTFERSVDRDVGARAAMRQAFDGIARVLFEGGILTADLLHKELPELVWDSAIAAGWWRLASETHQNIFPEQLGHYWVWREPGGDGHGLFRAEVGEWEAKLLEDTLVVRGTPAQVSAMADREAAIPVAGADGAKNSNDDKAACPDRAAWLNERLRERGWNKHDAFRQGGPDHKTVQKILDGRRVREDALEKLARALSKKLAKVDLLDIPQN